MVLFKPNGSCSILGSTVYLPQRKTLSASLRDGRHGILDLYALYFDFTVPCQSEVHYSIWQQLYGNLTITTIGTCWTSYSTIVSQGALFSNWYRFGLPWFQWRKNLKSRPSRQLGDYRLRKSHVWVWWADAHILLALKCRSSPHKNYMPSIHR